MRGTIVELQSLGIFRPAPAHGLRSWPEMGHGWTCGQPGTRHVFGARGT